MVVRRFRTSQPERPESTVLQADLGQASFFCSCAGLAGESGRTAFVDQLRVAVPDGILNGNRYLHLAA